MEFPKEVQVLGYTPSQSVLDCNSLFQFKGLHRTHLSLPRAFLTLIEAVINSESTSHTILTLLFCIHILFYFIFILFQLY